MKLHLLTYADELYLPMQKKLVEHCSSLRIFDAIFYPNREHLISTYFYRKNKYILDQPKGGGYCAWKPYYILETLMTMKEGDVLLYMDSADWIVNSENMRSKILSFMADKDIVLTAGAFPQKDWTKRDCFYYMNCDEEKYWNATQIEAGVILIRKTKESRVILEDWMYWCCRGAVITDAPNICELPNFDTFKEGRYDQSILTNIAIKKDLLISDFMRTFVVCNYQQ